MKKAVFLFFLFTICYYPQDLQDISTNPSIELKYGIEVYRSATSAAVAYNINRRSISFTFEFGSFGGLPLIHGGIKVPLRIFTNWSVYPKLGVGLSIVKYPTFLAGLGTKFSLTPRIGFVFEANYVFIKAPMVAYRNKNLTTYPPFSILVGIELQ